MPKCKNYDTGTYKGTEPSPKGRGYCAKGEKINKKMKGTDGNMWIISETKTGAKRWVKFTKQSKTLKNKSKLIKTAKFTRKTKRKTIKKSKSKKKTKRKSKIIEKFGSIQNYYINDNIQNQHDLLYSRILADGLEKLFKIKMKQNKKNNTYEFIIERKKKYPEFNIVEQILIMSGGSNNTEILIENKKVSKKDFTKMQKDNKYIYVIDNVGQNEIKLLIYISGDNLGTIELEKIITI